MRHSLGVLLGLGLALAQPKRRVIALEGDGSILMQLGALATIANLNPKNLVIVVWDNGMYQITGSQPAATAATLSLAALFWIVRERRRHGREDGV